MSLLGLVVGIIAVVMGVRYLTTALQTLLRRKLLVRQGFRTQWHAAPESSLIWKTALRDSVMGALLIVLGITLIT